jgi:Trypsin-like peptidase domain
MNSLMRLSVLLFVALPWVVSAQQGVRQLAQKTFPSVVLLVMQDTSGQPLSLGSGFFVGDGIIATNLHVVRGASAGYAKLIGRSETYALSGLVALDVNADLVLLKVAGTNAPPLHLTDSNDAAVGDAVYAVGNPEGLEGTFSQGIVSGLRGMGSEVGSEVGSESLLQITAPISPGSSGGPIIDSRGEVVGVAVATFREGQNLNFAIPSSYLASLLKRIGEVRSLPTVKEVREESRPFAQSIGENTDSGVTGTDFEWGGYLEGTSFTLVNQTGSSVKDVRFLLVFMGGDKKHGLHPIDYAEGATCPGVVLLPRLPKRQKEFSHRSPTSRTDEPAYCGLFYGDDRVKHQTRRVEIRVLDFKFAE